MLIVLGFGGGLLHVVNHALFKGLLFLGAGAVLHGTGTLEIDHLGGLLKRMPWTAATFLIGAVAISGLPPLNGFVSEFLIFLGAFKGGVSTDGAIAVPLLALIAGLALIGGLAVACFTKAFGIVFLGEPRSEHVSHAHEADWTMRLPMLILAAGCVLIGLFAPVVVGSLQAVLESLTRLATRSGQRKSGRRGKPAGMGCDRNRCLSVVAAVLDSVAARSAGGPPGGNECHLGMRLRAADRADAIHRLIVCPTADGFVQAVARHEEKNFAATRFFPGRSGAENRDA